MSINGLSPVGFSPVPGNRSYLYETDNNNNNYRQGTNSFSSNYDEYVSRANPINDGKFSIVEAGKNFCKGVGKFFTDIVKTAVKHPIITTLAVAAAVGICLIPGGALVLGAAGVALGAFGVVGSGINIGYNLATGNNDEAERGFTDLGKSTMETIASVFAFSKATKAATLVAKGASVAKGTQAASTAVGSIDDAAAATAKVAGSVDDAATVTAKATSIGKEASTTAKKGIEIGTNVDWASFKQGFVAPYKYVKGGIHGEGWNISKMGNHYIQGVSDNLMTYGGKMNPAKFTPQEIESVTSFAQGLKKVNVPDFKFKIPEVGLEQAKAYANLGKSTAIDNWAPVGYMSTRGDGEGDVPFVPFI